jgi:hypothetical protein
MRIYKHLLVYKVSKKYSRRFILLTHLNKINFYSLNVPLKNLKTIFLVIFNF